MSATDRSAITAVTLIPTSLLRPDPTGRRLGVGQADAPPVEQDHPRERGQLLDEFGPRRLVPPWARRPPPGRRVGSRHGPAHTGPRARHSPARAPLRTPRA